MSFPTIHFSTALVTSEEREIIFLPTLTLRPIPISCVSFSSWIYFKDQFSDETLPPHLGCRLNEILARYQYTTKHFIVSKAFTFANTFTIHASYSLTHFTFDFQKNKKILSLVGQILLSHFRDKKTEVLQLQWQRLDENLWLSFTFSWRLSFTCPRYISCMIEHYYRNRI